MVCRGEGYYAAVLGRCEAAFRNTCSRFAFCLAHIQRTSITSYNGYLKMTADTMKMWLYLRLALGLLQGVSTCEPLNPYLRLL